MKKLLLFISSLTMFFSINSVSADVIKPSNSLLNVGTVNSSNQFYSSVSSGLDSAFQKFTINESMEFRKLPTIFYIAVLNAETDKIYTSKFLLRIHYDYDIYDRTYFTIDNNIGNYNISVLDDTNSIRDSSCNITNKNIIKINDNSYDVDYDLSCVFTVNQNVSNHWFYMGFRGKSYDYDSFIGVIPPGSASYTQLLWYEHSAQVDYDGIIVDQNQTIIDQNNQTNENLENINESLTDESPPDSDGLNGAAGWLPAGPVDSLINLPLSFFNSISRDLGSSCKPVSLPLPYVNKNLTLPCMSTFYEGIKINSFMDWVGLIASGFILFSYLLKLYKWVDDTLTFRENNHLDNWGGV